MVISSNGDLWKHTEFIENKNFSFNKTKILNSLSEKDIDDLLVGLETNGGLLEMLKALPKLSGDESILDTAEQVLIKAPGSVKEDIAQLRLISKALKARYPEQSLYFDLSEIRGYEYHTGVVFAAYTSDFGTSIAKGGRYDDIGKGFGRARAATGFDSDLKNLLNLSKKNFSVEEKIFAPTNDDNELKEFIATLRAQGKQVLTALSGDGSSAQDLACTQEIVQIDGKWELKPL